ncbi:MAG TPA: efflux RND transporter periplasmic adaptor subunit [Gemmatimonadaceae bacterium]|nr:efflux RND transporter periplasmic adaptor subunit [Gemmatimonadaceae bacterium]
MSSILCRVVVIGALLAVGACKKKEPPRRPPTPVSVTTVHRTTMPYVVTSNGVVEPLQTVSVQAQVSGILQRVAFSEGQDVHVGDVLFQIDSRPYVATLNQARGQLARDEAQAASARREAARYEALVQQGYVTRSQTDQVAATAASANASVEADRAAVAKAQVDVANSTIRAPISGRTGSLLVRQGNVVKSGGDPLVVINQIQPILVRFTVPQSQFPDIQKYYAGNKALTVRVTPSEGSSTHYDGALSFVDNNVDANSGTVLLKAKFINADGTLWPGQFVKVALQLYVDANALTLPTAAVLASQQGSYVFTVDEKSSAKQQPVVVGRSVDSVAVIASGLKEGDRVILTGQSRLTTGAKVSIKVPGAREPDRGGRK